MMWLIDKGYYDYDYEPTEKMITIENTQRSDEETRSLVKRFGFGVTKEPTAEELQQIAINQNKEE